MPRSGRKSRKDGFQDDRRQEEAEAVPSSGDEEEHEGLPKKVAAEIAKLKKDNKGLITVRIKKPNASFSKQDVESDFGHFGKIADIHFTDSFVYIRYKTQEEAEKAITLMHDTYTIDVPNVSKGWNPKEPEEVSAKVAKLSPDTRGWYSIRIVKPNVEFKEKDAESNFGKYGEIADIHFTEKFVYVRYLSWKEAANAVRGLCSKFDLDIPNVSDAWKPQKSHADKGPQIYIGNISHKASKEEVAELLERYTPREFKFYSINNKNFAFAYFESARECKAVVSDLNGKVLRGTALYVRICRDRSRARYIADDDYQSKKDSDRKKGFRGGDFKTTSPFGQGIVELYVSNFGWNITQADLAALFQSHGQLAYVEVMPLTQQSGECRKAYVGLYDAYEAKQAMHKLNQRSWNGLKLNVAYSTRNPVKSGGPHHGGADSNQLDYGSNPVDRAYTLSNKLDIMLEDVLDKCDFCVKIHGLMSELQQAIREIKYQALRGDIMQGLNALNEIIDQLGTQQHTTQLPQQYGNSGPPQQYPGGKSMNPPMNQQFRQKILEEFYANGASGVQNQFYGGGGMMAEGGSFSGGNQSPFYGNGAGLGGFGAASRGHHGNRSGGYGRGRGRGNRYD